MNLHASVLSSILNNSLLIKVNYSQNTDYQNNERQISVCNQYFVDETRTTCYFFIGFFVLMILWLLTDPMPQPLNYHDFSDSRRWLGIQNSANVISNLPFLLIGTYGLFELKRNTYGSSFPLLIYSIFFFSVTLISIGSAMYHLSPNSDLLVLDRLPMSASFTSLFSIIIGKE